MFKIDSEGATVDNKFTEGDPGLGVPATVVSDDWLNAVQGELVTVIESMGLALSKPDSDQLWESLKKFGLRGLRFNPFSATIANNTGPADVTDDNNSGAFLTIDKTLHKGKRFYFQIERQTDSNHVIEYGEVYLAYNSKDDVFEQPRVKSLNGDAGVIFSLAQIGATDEYKLQYTSNNLAGASYVGSLDIISINEISQ